MSWAGVAAYCTADNLKPFIDKRIMGKLLSDEGRSGVLADPWADTVILPGVIASVSGELEAALFVGCKYTVEQIQGMEANGLQFLYRLLAGLILQALYERRGVMGSREQENMPTFTNWARRMLDMMRKGTRILPIPEVAEARAGATTRDESMVARNNRNAFTSRFFRAYGRR